MYVLTLYIFVWCIWSLLSCMGSLLYRLEQKRAGLHILDFWGHFCLHFRLGGQFCLHFRLRGQFCLHFRLRGQFTLNIHSHLHCYKKKYCHFVYITHLYTFMLICIAIQYKINAILFILDIYTH